jgi:hypothetical protein
MQDDGNILLTRKRKKTNRICLFLRNSCLPKHIMKWREDEEENVSSYWMTLRKGEDSGNRKRKHKMALCVELTLEEALANYQQRPSYWAGIHFGHMFCSWAPEGDTCLRCLNVSFQVHALYIIITFLHLICLLTDLRQSAAECIYLCVNYLRSQLSGDLNIMSAGSHTEKLHGINNIIT